MAGPVIIEAAINGVTSKKHNPNTPKEPAEIADDALRCFAAGAAVVHNHIDAFGLDGNSAAERYLEGWRPVLEERPDALFYPTTNAGPDVVASYAHIGPLAESGLMRLSLCDPGSVNLGGLGPDGLPASGIVYANSFDDVAHQFGLCDRYGLGPSIAIYEPGFARAGAALARAAGVKAPIYRLMFCRGLAVGFPPRAYALGAYHALLEEEAPGAPWMIAAVNADLRPLFAETIARCGHIRVGLEDAPLGTRATNLALVEEAVRMVRENGAEPASPAEMRLALAASASRA